tara:strand:- start:2920 stop:3762 length:843 start_codon:yes stop_codon:yes gene_type:complete
MSRSYSEKVYNDLKENKLTSLKILLEKEEDKETAEDVFNVLDKEEEERAKEEQSEEESKEDSSAEGDVEQSDEEDVDADEDEEISDALDDKALEDSLEKAEKILSNIAKNQEDPFSGPEGPARSAERAFSLAAINASTNESFNIIEKFYTSNSIKSFINEDEEKIQKMSDSMSDLEDQLKKYTKTIDSVVKGVDIHMPTFVEEAMKDLENFDHKFSKSEIIFKMFKNVLAANSGKNAEKNIEEFEKMFYQELHKKEKTHDDKHVLPVEKTHTAVGATKQS